MSVNEIVEKYKSEEILEAAKRIEVTKRLKDSLKGTRWDACPIVFDNITFISPTFEERRPLAITLHSYGLYVVPINLQVEHGRDFVLYVEEGEDELRIYVENSFHMELRGDYKKGFNLQIKKGDNTDVEVADKE